MYWRPSVRWVTSPRCSRRTSIVATVVSASRRPVIARWTSVTDASSRDHSTCMTASCDAVRRGVAAAFRGMPEYYTRRRRTALKVALRSRDRLESTPTRSRRPLRSRRAARQEAHGLRFRCHQPHCADAHPIAQTRIVGGAFSAFQYDVAPDGRFILNVLAADAAPLTLLSGWTSRLNR